MTRKTANQIKKLASAYQRDKELRKAYLLGAARQAQIEGLSKKAAIAFAKKAAENFEKRAAMEESLNHKVQINKILSSYYQG